MKLAPILYNLGAVAVIIFFLYFLIKKIAPKIKASSKKLEEEKSQKLLEENKTIFRSIFGFLPGDAGISEEIGFSLVFETLGHLSLESKKISKSKEELFRALPGDSFLGGEDTKIILDVCEKNFYVLRNVDRGLGFYRIMNMKNYAFLLALEKEHIFLEAKRVAIALGFGKIERIIF